VRIPSKQISVLLAVLLSVSFARAQAVKIAAAADLKFAMTELAAQFEKQSGAKLDVTYGSSGNFLTQIQNGAPFDLFFFSGLRISQKTGSRRLGRTRHLS